MHNALPGQDKHLCGHANEFEPLQTRIDSIRIIELYIVAQ